MKGGSFESFTDMLNYVFEMTKIKDLTVFVEVGDVFQVSSEEWTGLKCNECNKIKSRNRFDLEHLDA